MQQKQSDPNNTVEQQAEEKPATTIVADPASDTMSFNTLNKQIFQFFREKDYECFESFKQGYSKNVNEDYTNIDLLCNLNDLVYNYCSSKRMNPQEKKNFKQMCQGIQMLNTSLKQYDTNNSDKVFVANIAGYLLKVIKNFYHD